MHLITSASVYKRAYVSCCIQIENHNPGQKLLVLLLLILLSQNKSNWAPNNFPIIFYIRFACKKNGLSIWHETGESNTKLLPVFLSLSFGHFCRLSLFSLFHLWSVCVHIHFFLFTYDSFFLSVCAILMLILFSNSKTQTIPIKTHCLIHDRNFSILFFCYVSLFFVVFVLFSAWYVYLWCTLLKTKI